MAGRDRCWRLLVVAFALVLLLLPAAASGTGSRLDSPRAAEIALAGRISDRMVISSAQSRNQSYWGGRARTATGADVTLYISESYPEDPARAQRWRDFLGSLLHGEELARLTVFLSPLDEVQAVCGQDALACYNPASEEIYAPGDNPTLETSAEAVLTHEYGHHVARNRRNPPWWSVTWGPKRWASHEQVCAEAKGGRMFPGDARNLIEYRLNPGEGFAEAYRVLNERKFGLPESLWRIVSRVFYPDAAAAAAVERDVLQPWRGETSTTTRGTAASGPRSYTVQTTLDGVLKAALTAPPTGRFRLELISASGARIARTEAASTTKTVRATICGSRKFRARVTRLAGTGTFTLTVSKP
jgi:hypothetical protein